KQDFSQNSSCWHTRPQMPGNGLCSLILSNAPAKSHSANRSIKPLTSMCNGQSCTQTGSLHCKQRCASAKACSGVNPKATSGQPTSLSSGGANGSTCLGNLGLGFLFGLGWTI